MRALAAAAIACTLIYFGYTEEDSAAIGIALVVLGWIVLFGGGA